MKTLIFNGSPRIKGNTAYLIDHVKGKLEGEVQVINAYGADIQGCIDCRYCWSHPRCAWPDWQAIDQSIREADHVLVASPIYFSELTGNLLKVLSKTQVYWSARVLRQEKLFSGVKKGGIILTYAGHCQLEHPLHTAKILLHNMNAWEIFPPVISGDTDNVEARDDGKALAECDALANFFNGRE